MRKKRYSADRIVASVQQHETGMSVAEISHRLRIVEQTFYRWKKEYSGLEPSQVREFKQLRDENAALKKLVADLNPDRAMLQDINSRKW